MSSLVHYSQCPVCGSNDLRDVFPVKDHTVSKKFFEIIECRHCALRLTQDVPDSMSIGPYYSSEEYISHTNTSRGIINSLYQVVRKLTMKSKRKLVERTTGLKKGSLLDVGGGTGNFANEMRKAGWEVTLLEPDKGAREKASHLYGLQAKDSPELFRLGAGSFDAITLWHVLEHVHELNRYVDQLKVLLKRNGKLLIAVPNYTSFDGESYQQYWAAYDVPRHLYHFSPKSMEELMKRHGLTIEKYYPLWFDSYYISLLSSKYKNGRSNYFSSVLKGSVSNLKAMRDVKRCSSVVYVIKDKR